LGIPARQVEKTMGLLDEGATIPFISRYRKEVTGGLDEVQIGDINDHYGKLKEVSKRKRRYWLLLMNRVSLPRT
jgi:Transcriptional accessory protein